MKIWRLKSRMETAVVARTMTVMISEFIKTGPRNIIKAYIYEFTLSSWVCMCVMLRALVTHTADTSISYERVFLRG